MTAGSSSVSTSWTPKWDPRYVPIRGARYRRSVSRHVIRRSPLGNGPSRALDIAAAGLASDPPGNRRSAWPR